eukprot:4774013-Amphidinium_carterae.1
MADFLRQTVERQLSSQAARRPSVYVITDRDPCISWRRMTLRALRLWIAAACQAVTMELSVLSEEPPTRTEEAQPAHPAAVRRVVILARAPLPPSQADKPLATGDCNHEQFQTKGNKYSK